MHHPSDIAHDFSDDHLRHAVARVRPKTTKISPSKNL